MSMHKTLIAFAELRPEMLLIDVSFDLGDSAAGERAYAAGHLPGAHYLHLERDLSGAKTGSNGRHPLPDRAAFAERMRALGLSKHTQVVAYDAQGGMYAARLWWMLRWIGHEAAAVLDGGPRGTLSAELPQALPGDFAMGPSLVPTLSADELQARLGNVRLVDARAPERFRGEVEPLDRQAGHIPGASNRLFKLNLQADGTFKPVEVLRAEFEDLLAPFAPEQVVHQCGSGVTACHNLLAMEYAQLPGSALYAGSWSEWSSDPVRPVAKG
ncbi:MAG: sulfurtransferase [Paucibacter sp.]|nr:sulfurtransferase [Roseateles sp.]